MQYKNHLFFGIVLTLILIMSSFAFLNKSPRLIKKVTVSFESQDPRNIMVEPRVVVDNFEKIYGKELIK